MKYLKICQADTPLTGMDYKEAKEIRMKIYDHLNRYLKPPNPFRSVKDLQKAGYGFN